MRDSFGYLVGDIDLKLKEVRIRKAKRWLGRSYKKVVQYIADDYVKNKLDHLVIVIVIKDLEQEYYQISLFRHHAVNVEMRQDLLMLEIVFVPVMVIFLLLMVYMEIPRLV